ncbi:hypothetical protein GCM10028833_40590 [Glycomyces tarimensis]
MLDRPPVLRRAIARYLKRERQALSTLAAQAQPMWAAGVMVGGLVVAVLVWLLALLVAGVRWRPASGM